MNHSKAPNYSYSPVDEAPIREHYAQLRKRTFIRLLVIYIFPLILLSIYFHLQFTLTLTESSKSHLRSIAESQRNTIDLFLQERVVNLRNLFNSPLFSIPPSEEIMERCLNRLKQNNPTFVDLGLFNENGIHIAYAGPYSFLKGKDYSNEFWFTSMMEGTTTSVISDIYLGFRQKPHFTIAVIQNIEGERWVLRATVDPIRFSEFIDTMESKGNVFTFMVNVRGQYQSVPGHLKSVLETFTYPPHIEPTIGAEEIKIRGEAFLSAYSWLREVEWCLVVLQPLKVAYASIYRTRFVIIAISLIFLVLIVAIIFFTTKKMIGRLEKTDLAKEDLQRQLFHAAKLASVGELSAGIAHEINNPLAIIGEEAGLMKDMLDPQLYTEEVKPEDFNKHLDTIISAVFRGRDITKKLLGFVRKDEVKVELESINEILGDVVEMMSNEMMISNIIVKQELDPTLPVIYTNRNQLQQVIINFVTNAIAAITPPGTISFRTMMKDGYVVASVSDTGCGMPPEQIEKIFFPFYTTKEVGKGTGLGLSVSYGIIKSLGGRIEVSSEVGKGSTFEIMLPLKTRPKKVLEEEAGLRSL